MKTGRWSDRIAEAKHRGTAKRKGKVIKLERKSKSVSSLQKQAEEWNLQWRKRIADARARGRERARIYRGRRMYEAAIYDQNGRFQVVFAEGLNNDAHARAYIQAAYEPKEIIAMICIGYKNPEPERSNTMPDGRPKLNLELD